MRKLTDLELQIQYLMNQITEKKSYLESLKDGYGVDSLREMSINNCKREIRTLCAILETVGVSKELAETLGFSNQLNNK